MDLRWIAVRMLTVGDKELQVRLAEPIWIPHPDDDAWPSGEGPSWVCYYEISMEGHTESFSSRAFDSWQAVIRGLLGASTLIDERFPDACWMGFQHPAMQITHPLVFRNSRPQRELEARLMEAFFEIRGQVGSHDE